MSLTALFTWIVTASAGLSCPGYLAHRIRRVQLPSAAATRCQIPVISAHALLAVARLVTWAAYSVADAQPPYAAALTLVVVPRPSA